MKETRNVITGKSYRTNEKSLIQEIKAMLDDYFVCSASCDNNTIIMSFENGQKFKLHISKAA